MAKLILTFEVDEELVSQIDRQQVIAKALKEISQKLDYIFLGANIVSSEIFLDKKIK